MSFEQPMTPEKGTPTERERLHGLLRTPEEEGEIARTCETWPTFERRYNDGAGEIFLRGDKHFFNAEDAEAMREQFEREKPDLVLIEGSSLEMPITAEMDGQEVVEKYGDQGYAVWLARKAGVDVRSWDPPMDVLFERAVIDHGADAVLGWIIGQGGRHLMDSNRPMTPVALRELMGRANLEKAPGSFAKLDIDLSDAHMEEIARRYTGKSFGEITYEDAERICTPRERGETNDVIRGMNEMRDRNAVDMIAEAKKTHKKIFVTAGGSHVVTWEPAMKALYVENE